MVGGEGVRTEDSLPRVDDDVAADDTRLAETLLGGSRNQPDLANLAKLMKVRTAFFECVSPVCRSRR